MSTSLEERTKIGSSRGAAIAGLAFSVIGALGVTAVGSSFYAAEKAGQAIIRLNEVEEKERNGLYPKERADTLRREIATPLLCSSNPFTNLGLYTSVGIGLGICGWETKDGTKHGISSIPEYMSYINQIKNRLCSQ